MAGGTEELEILGDIPPPPLLSHEWHPVVYLQVRSGEGAETRGAHAEADGVELLPQRLACSISCPGACPVACSLALPGVPWAVALSLVSQGEASSNEARSSGHISSPWAETRESPPRGLRFAPVPEETGRGSLYSFMTRWRPNLCYLLGRFRETQVTSSRRKLLAAPFLSKAVSHSWPWPVVTTSLK